VHPPFSYLVIADIAAVIFKSSTASRIALISLFAPICQDLLALAGLGATRA
jgi:hypothetical protein